MNIDAVIHELVMVEDKLQTALDCTNLFMRGSRQHKAAVAKAAELQARRDELEAARLAYFAQQQQAAKPWLGRDDFGTEG